MKTSPVSRGRCDAHNLAQGPDGACVLCRRERAASPWPAITAAARHPNLRRAGAAVALLSTLFGGAAFAGVAAARANTRAAAAATLEVTPSVPRHDVAAPAEAPQTCVPHAPRPVAHPPIEAAAPPAPQPATPVEPLPNRLDEALAALPRETATEGTSSEVPGASPAPCVQRRPRPTTVSTTTTTTTNMWGPDHDRYGELHVKPWHWVWSTSSTSTRTNRPPPPPPCPQVQWHPLPAGMPNGVAPRPGTTYASPTTPAASAPTRVSYGQRGGFSSSSPR